MSIELLKTNVRPIGSPKLSAPSDAPSKVKPNTFGVTRPLDKVQANPTPES